MTNCFKALFSHLKKKSSSENNVNRASFFRKKKIKTKQQQKNMKKWQKLEKFGKTQNVNQMRLTVCTISALSSKYIQIIKIIRQLAHSLSCTAEDVYDFEGCRQTFTQCLFNAWRIFAIRRSFHRYETQTIALCKCSAECLFVVDARVLWLELWYRSVSFNELRFNIVDSLFFLSYFLLHKIHLDC